jgi:hypothetical protein
LNEPEAARPSWVRFLLGAPLVAVVFCVIWFVDSILGGTIFDGHGYLGPLNGYFEVILAISGAVLGLAQLVMVVGPVEQRLWWVLATASGFLLGGLSVDVLYLAGLVPQPGRHDDGHPFGTVMWLLIATLTAIGQWWTLRRFRFSPIWIVAAALAMGAGALHRMAPGVLYSDAVFIYGPAIVYALITALALFAILWGGKKAAISE